MKENVILNRKFCLFKRKYYNWTESFISLKKSIKIRQKILFSLKERAIWKSRHQHIGISIGIDVGIGIGISKNLFSLAKSLFLLLEVLYEKTSMVEYFSSTLGDLPKSFRQCLEQLFCRKRVNACFWRKELHNRRYLRSFKNTQDLKLHFAGL